MTTRMSVEDFRKLKKKPNKYHAQRVEIDGINFDSKAEAEYYLTRLKPNPYISHIDVHPIITLPGGIRFKTDFIVWRKDGLEYRAGDGSLYVKNINLKAEVIEVKGFITQDFRRMRKLFDAFHPLAPLIVYRKTKNGWESI